MARKKTTVKREQTGNDTLVIAKTKNQSLFIKSMNENQLTICDGPSGTGKTYCTAGVACEHLINKKVDKIIITRSTQQCGNSGFLPGSMSEKLSPFMHPLTSKFEEFLGSAVYKKMLLDKTIEIFPLETMRGETFDRTFMILTEFQNATYEQIMMFVTRIGEESKCVVEGDMMQIDAKNSGGERFHDEQLTSKDKGQGIGFSYFSDEDIVRSGIVKTIIMNARKAYREENNNPYGNKNLRMQRV